MEKTSIQREFLSPKKLLRKLKIAFILLAISFPIAFASPGPDMSENDKSYSYSGDELQQLVINGTVTDRTTGDPMPGVNVVVVGTNVGALTDITGKYSLTLPDKNAVLNFSFIGYNSAEIAYTGNATINIALEPAIQALDEVIVIGYGTQKKSDLTGSVVRINMEDRVTLANTNLSQALSGVTAGVNVNQTNGLAGAEPNLAIRGQTSLSASDQPLIVIDGIIYNGSVTDINLNDVESVDILKDASAAAVYGSRSANGVMLITTKKGKSEKPVVSFNMYYGYQNMTNNPMKVMNGDDYAIRLSDYNWQQDLYIWYKTNPTSDAGKPVRPDINNRALIATFLRTQEERDNYNAMREIDWVKEVTQVAPIQNYNLSLSGISGSSNYFVSASYTNEEGIILNDHFKRFTLHSNIQSSVTDWLTIGLNSTYSIRDYSGQNVSLSDARTATPWADNHIGKPDFVPYLTGELYMPYPLASLYADNKDVRTSLFNVANAKLTLPWIKGLTYELNFSTTNTDRTNNTFSPVTIAAGSQNRGRAEKHPDKTKNWIVNNIVSYNQTFGDHQVNATLLYSRENRQGEDSDFVSEGFDNDVLGYDAMELGTLLETSSGAWEENSLSYMARANYTYKNRYLITGTFRRDGFSGFGAAKKFANFPSVSVGWVASSEPFLSDVKWLYLKLRTSYGVNGNQGIGRYSSFSRMGTRAMVFGPITYIGVYPSTLGNSDLAWETTASLNAGIDWGLFNRRISGSIEVYKSTTDDVLVERALPSTTGYSDVWANIGSIESKGIELELRTVNLTKGPVTWESNFTFSLNRDKITTLYGGANDRDVGNGWFVGQSIDVIYDYKEIGSVWTEEELYSGNILDNWYPGQFKYVDQNDDGLIESVNDRTFIGNYSPNFRFSINNTLAYQSFTLSFFLNSIMGGNGYYMADNSSVLNIDWNADSARRINASDVRPYWTPDNGVTNATGVFNAPIVHGGIYQSRGFVRLQDISLSYKLGPNVLRTLQLEACQFYIASKNPYVWTKWSGWDPETGTSNNPMMRNITAGVRITL